MIHTTKFSPDDLQKFSEILGGLQIACHPAFGFIAPSVQIMSPRDSLYGSKGCYTIQELTDAAEKGQTLPSHITHTLVGGTHWFSTDEEPFDFYSSKHTVLLAFSPQRVNDPKILEDSSVANYVKIMLGRIAQRNISAAAAAKVFPESICRKVYELTPPHDYILYNLNEAIEQTRRTLFLHLQKHHEQDIRKLPDFPAFQSTYHGSKDVILAFLGENYLGFSLAEDWGYIKNSQELIKFQQLRNIPRHMKKLNPDPLQSPEIMNTMTSKDWNRWIYHMGYPHQSPTQLYAEFQKALPFVTPKTPAKIVSYEDAICAIRVQTDLEKLKEIRKTLRRAKKLETFMHKNFPDEISTETVTIEKPDKTRTQETITLFSSFYIRGKGIVPDTLAKPQPDGSILLKEVDFHDWYKLGDDCAHTNEGFKESAKILSEDMPFLSDFVSDLTDVFDQKISQIQTRQLALKSRSTPDR